MIETFLRDNPSVTSRRILYTPSSFARSCLLHLQEAGTLAALKPHINHRSNLSSYLLFVVMDGEGELIYNGKTYPLSTGNCVFIDCQQPYTHQTSHHLWTLKWIHFNGPTMPGIYRKYIDRGGNPVCKLDNLAVYAELLERIHQTAADTEDYVRDMHLNEQIAALLSHLMAACWSPGAQKYPTSRHQLIPEVKAYLELHYHEKIILDDLAALFFINKFYLARLFKEQTDTSIISYLLLLRISRAKEQLRFTDLTIDEISRRCGFSDKNYFSRTFRKYENLSPSEYRKMW